MANSAEWKVVPLVASVNQRYADTSVDGLLRNAFLEKDETGTIWIRRRSGYSEGALSFPDGYQGLSILQTQGTPQNVLTGGRNLIGKAVIFTNGSLSYTFTNPGIGLWFNQSTVISHIEYYASNGLEAAYNAGAGFVKITDVNYPSSTLPGSAYLNGYLYVIDNNGSIWGTPNQNDFSTWSSTNVVNAWGTTGNPVGIFSYLNEILAFKSKTVEVFYDGGGSVGSPLLPVQQISIKWGTDNYKSIVKIDEEIFWVGSSSTEERAVIRMNGFTPTPISNSAINRIIQSSSDYWGWSCQMSGNKFYILTVQTAGFFDGQGVSLYNSYAYNLSTGSWSSFRFDAKTNQLTTSPIISSTTGVSGVYAILGNGQVVSFSDSSTNDASHVPGNSTVIKTPISMGLRTDNFEAGTTVRKMVSGLRLKADQKSASMIRIRWSDDDYQTWSSWRGIDLSKSPAQLPGLQGTFNKRAYEIEYAGSDPIRISHLELLIALGDI